MITPARPGHDREIGQAMRNQAGVTMRSFGKIWSGTAFLCVTAWLGWGGAAMAAVASPGQLTSCEALRGEARADLVIAEATSLPASAPAPAWAG